MLFMVIISAVLSSVLIILNMALAMKKISDREKSSPFECGYDPSTSARLPFSLQFFLVAIIFLIFDVEITILLPMPILMNFTMMRTWTILSVVFILILIFGVAHEWTEGSLEWSN